MVKLTVLAGGFSTFISTYVFDSDAGSLNLVKDTTTGGNPSWITLHPQNSSILYAVNENPTGALQSFTVGQDGALTLVDTVNTGGNGPTFTAVLSTGEVTGLNFGSASMAIVPTDPNDPLKFVDSPNNLVSFPVPSNPHMSLEHKGEVFIPDLGGDKIWRLKKNGSKFAVQGKIDFPLGNGPRHIAIKDEILFTVHETSSRLTAQTIPTGASGSTPLIANVSTVPPPPSPGFNGSFFAAEILISESTTAFPDSYIYVSNRNLGPDLDPKGDTIAIFQYKNSSSTTEATAGGDQAAAMRRNAHSRVFSRRQTDATSQGQLVLIAQIPTGLNQIRSMALGSVKDGGDEFLIAGANTQGGVAVFKRTDGGKNLELVTRNTDHQNRTSFVFL
ncbi:putative isomerase YbhE [Crepidotus variabilis]|uniref:Isomerase YbhE n=1 Tax=Crepidotus variabilis TaxID=179855 RepID=A0A9P6EM88_9AGAR|nr:putative isomerase YbhE [Crepidotus variabilis]